MLKSDLCNKLRERIKASKLWCQRSRESRATLSGLRCPECGKDEAWAYRDFPAIIMCNRKNQCGIRIKVLELFPEILGNIERDYAPTQSDPHRPAREYLHSRGIGCQVLQGLRFEYRKNIRKCGSGGVLFYIGRNEAGEEVWNGRIFSPPQGTGKTHNQGGTAGLFWKHPGVAYTPDRPTYVVEGIIEALSHLEMGHQAIAALSSGQDPAKINLGGLEENLVIAFDPDVAGAGGIKKWIAVYPDARAIVPIDGDWNDFLRAQAPGKAAEVFDSLLSEMKCRADLLIAESAKDYADIHTMFYGYPPGLFTFERRYWWAALKAKVKKGDSSAVDVHCVSDFTCETEHYSLDTSSPDNPVYRYHLKVMPAAGQPCFCAVTGAELANPWSIRSALLSYALVHWQGESAPSKVLVNKILDRQAPVVRQVHVLGHDSASGCLVFRDFLVDPEASIHLPDAKGFFRASRKEFLMPPAIPCISPRKGESAKRIYELISAAWPYNGPLGVAFAVASWFVYVVKPELGFFPFLSLHGDTQTGKTHLVRRLNAMQCLDEEGLPMTKLNTGKGEIRKLAQRSGLFKALLEGNKEDKLRFDMESLLTLYNYGNTLQVRAQKSNDIATRETDFLATLIFVQNKEPFKSKAQAERVISSKPFKAEEITEATTAAFRELLKVPLREMANCYIEVMKHRKRIESEWLKAYTAARDEIIAVIPDNRIAENHGLLLGFHRLAEKIFGVQTDMSRFFIWLAEWKHWQCNHRQSTLADHFFEACDEMSPEARTKFMEVGAGKVHIRLPLALKLLDGNGYKFYTAQLTQELREHPAFMYSRFSYRGHWGEVNSVAGKVWVFDETKMQA
ncbi:MAG: toprim domain-containing protein [Syntrophobacteraceae bacterium]